MKKFIIIVVILLLIFSAATIYLNKVFLPKKFKALLVTALAKQTGKEVSLKSLEFSFFRGLILRDLVIGDSQNVILSTRQATCRIFIWPIFKKQIIIPGVNLKAPYIFLQRRSDQSFNLQDFFALTGPQAQAKRPDFSVAVFKLTISNGNIVFQDDTLPKQVKKEIKNIQLNLQLGLPVKFKFNLTAQLLSQPPVLINASGEYKILSRELEGNLSLKDLSAGEFSAYYGDPGDLVSGLIDLQAQFELKNQLLQVDFISSGENLIFRKDTLRAELNSTLESKIDYNLESKKLEFSGVWDILRADLSGLEFLSQVKNLRGKFVFNQRSLFADGVKAELLGLPFQINLGIKDFSTKVFEISTDFDLSILPAIAKDKFNFSLISSAKGQAALSLKIHPDNQSAWSVDGVLEIIDADLKLDKVDSPVEDVDASLAFSQQGLSWADTRFRYQGVNYQSNGTLFDFAAPEVKLKLYSDDLSAEADFDLSDKKIKIAQLKGKYLDTQFLVSGDVDQSVPSEPRVDLTGKISLELSNLNKILGNKYPVITTLSPSGQLDTQFSIIGPVLDFKHCYLQVSAISSSIFLYGLKATDFTLDFLQEQGIAKIPTAYVTFYDGVIRGAGALNLNTEDLAYLFELKASGINLGKLKLDTPSKHKDIAGVFLGEVKFNGAGFDLNQLTASGNFAVSHGRLGELNLLQGLGKILLARDLGKIEFTDCSCDFLIKNKFIYTDKLKLHSSIVELAGPVKIGFDNSLAGVLGVDILNEMIPLDGTFKDITTALSGEGGKFGEIKLSGTLAEPKYSFKMAVDSIIHSLADMFFKK